MKFPEQWRIPNASGWESARGNDFGVFVIPGPSNRELRIIASNGTDETPWEHVSVSLPNRCPNWEEMDFIKRLFWDDEECVMQLHPPRSIHINLHPYCLHLWRPKQSTIPLPPLAAI